MITDIFHPNHPQNYIIQTYYEVAAEMNDPVTGMDVGDIVFLIVGLVFVFSVIGFLIVEAILNVMNKGKK